MHLVGFTIEIYYDARHYKRPIRGNFMVTVCVYVCMYVCMYSNTFTVVFSKLFSQTILQQSSVQIMIRKQVDRNYTYSAEHKIGVF